MRHIDGEEKLSAIFGAWPSFHDAEVLSLCYERTARSFDVTTVIHVFEMTSEVDQRGHYKIVKHTRVTLRCEDATDVQLEGFNGQNVLSSLSIVEEGLNSERTYVVTFGGCFGIEGFLRCQRVVVVDAIPWTPKHSVYAEEPNQLE